MGSSINKINKLLEEIQQVGIDMARVFSQHQSFFYGSKNWEREIDRLGLDNIAGNLCVYDMGCLVDRGDFASVLKFNECNVWFFDEVIKVADRMGYGAMAAARGYDVTKPTGRFWTLASNGLFRSKQLEEILNKIKYSHGNQ